MYIFLDNDGDGFGAGTKWDLTFYEFEKFVLGDCIALDFLALPGLNEPQPKSAMMPIVAGTGSASALGPGLEDIRVWIGASEDGRWER